MSAPKIQFDTRRSVAEWIGATPDSIPPDHVKLRIFERHKGICHIAKRKILGGEPWDVEHVVPLRDGGENREGNMAPALRDKHLKKTGQENSDRAIANRKKSKHLGLWKAKSRGFDKRLRKRMDGTVEVRNPTTKSEGRQG